VNWANRPPRTGARLVREERRCAVRCAVPVAHSQCYGDAIESWCSMIPPDGVPSGRPRSRGWLWASAAVGIAFVLAFGWVLFKLWTADPWTALERSLATYPAPPGWVAAKPSRYGSRPVLRFIAPDYQPASEELDLSPSGPRHDPCADLKASLAAWSRRGFIEAGLRDGGPCGWVGEINGHRVEAYVDVPFGNDLPPSAGPTIVVDLFTAPRPSAAPATGPGAVSGT
jgi:hypothetical protein